MKIALYQGDISFDSIDQFNNILFNNELRYLASDLTSFGLDNAEDLDEAVRRAIIACRSAREPVRKNFKEIFVSRNGLIYRDWRLSALGRKLVLINADPSNPVIARLQLELVKRI